MEHYYYYSPEKTGAFFKKLVFIIIFFTLTPIALISSAISLIAIADKGLQIEKDINQLENQALGVKVFASLPLDTPSLSFEIIQSDARPLIIKRFLELNNSPLAPYAEFIVETADKYGVDWRLTTAIAMKESGLCKVIPENSYNCWGWGIHSAGTLKFSSFKEGIETVTKGIRQNYMDIGLITPQEIMIKWVPHSPNGAWALDVDMYMKKML